MKVRFTIVVLVAGLLLMIGAAWMALTPNAQTQAQEQVVVIGVKESSERLEFDPAVVRVKNGRPVTLTLKNNGKMAHQLVLVDLDGEKVVMVDPGKEGSIKFTPKFQNVEHGAIVVLPFACHVGHPSLFDHFGLGMQGVLIVEP